MIKIISVIFATVVALIAVLVAPFNKGIKKSTSASGRKYTRLHYTPLLGAAMERALILGGHGAIGTPAFFWLSHKGDMTVVIFDGLMNKLSPLAQAFVFLHEEGHVNDDTLIQNLGSVSVEVVADNYAICKLGLKQKEDIAHVFDELLKFVKEMGSEMQEEAILQLEYRKGMALTSIE